MLDDNPHSVTLAEQPLSGQIGTAWLKPWSTQASDATTTRYPARQNRMP
jgi:hypothetical protein